MYHIYILSTCYFEFCTNKINYHALFNCILLILLVCIIVHICVYQDFVRDSTSQPRTYYNSVLYSSYCVLISAYTPAVAHIFMLYCNIMYKCIIIVCRTVDIQFGMLW